MNVILDTNLLIDEWRPPWGHRVAISVASIAELNFGLLRSSDPVESARRMRILARVEHEFNPVPVSADVARNYAQCAQALYAVGRNPRARVWDLIIAATALTHGATLYTLDKIDFVGLENLIDIVVPELTGADSAERLSHKDFRP